MSYRVNATFEDAFACQDRLISEKGYPEDTIVIINGNYPIKEQFEKRMVFLNFY